MLTASHSSRIERAASYAADLPLCREKASDA